MKIHYEPGTGVAEPGGIDLDALLPVPKPITAPPAPSPSPTPPSPAPQPTTLPAPKPGDKIQFPGAYDELSTEFDKMTGKEPPAPPKGELDDDSPVPPTGAGTPPPPPAATPSAGGEEKFEKVKDLRAAYDAKKKQVADMEAKLADYEARIKAAGQAVDVSAFEKRIKDAETQRDELAKRLSFVSYEKSPEFEEKYLTPLKTHIQAVVADIGELTVTDANGQEVPATIDHFWALVQAPLKEASKLAQEYFGPAAPLVMSHRNQFVQLQRAKTKAVEDYRNNATEIEKKRMADAQLNAQRNKEVWERMNNDVADRVPELFKPDEKDPQKTERLTKGLKYFDVLHDPSAPLNPEQRARLAAAVRYKSAGFDVLYPIYRETVGKLEALTKELDELRGSAPPAAGGVKPGGTPNTTPIDPNDVELHMRLMSEGMSVEELMKRTGRPVN